MRRHANYALVYVGAHLGQDPGELDVARASFVGDETDAYEFEVPTPPRITSASRSSTWAKTATK